MQVLEVELTFGADEANIEKRILDIRVDNGYPLEFSIVNAGYDINSFEQNTNAKLQLKNIMPTYNNSYYTGCAYNVYLYFKFPLNTFLTSDKNINSTFDEYNTKITNDNIEFISSMKIKEQREKKEQTDNSFTKIAITVIVILALIGYVIIEYKKKVIIAVQYEYLKYDSLESALSNGMPNTIKYKIEWLKRKIYELQQRIEKGPERSNRTWHGPYGWEYESTKYDKEKFYDLKRKLNNLKKQLYDLEMKKSNTTNDK